MLLSTHLLSAPAIAETIWLPEKDSNPYKQSQSLSCYHYTIGQFLCPLAENVYYYTLLF